VVVQVGSIGDPGGTLLVETSSNPLGDGSLLSAADRGDVQTLDTMLDEEIHMLEFQPTANLEFV
jgi:hypothetical protein